MSRVQGFLKLVIGLLALSLGLIPNHGPVAANDEEDAGFVPRILPASEDARRAMVGFQVPEGFEIELVAAEPALANPVAFTLDEQGRLYVAETFRLHDGVTDIRGHMHWLEDDLASRTVEDRVAMYRKYLGEDFPSYGIAQDRIRRLEDTNGDGIFDRSTLFADGFDDVAAGIGAGVLARDGTVWYTCIPHLWRLEDSNGDGYADVREALHDGYGVHVGFIGHDLHGLTFGPDGKLYFSIGDRGLNVRTLDGIELKVIDSGSVLRCDPDGTNLEVYATGLRNPQELAFDQYGNLFTVDNNCDAGDQCRLIDLVEGGNSGWTIGYQFLGDPVPRGPWMQEDLWRTESTGNDAAYLLPPLANFSDGPSGFTYDPGTGISERYRNHFFLADFRGTPGNSGIRSFQVEPKGSTFEMVNQHQFLWSILATDVDFNLDGGLYISDWVEGWDQPGKGRIYRLFDPELNDASTQGQIKAILSEGMNDRTLEELGELLRHDDLRIRQRAQFALADRGAEAFETLKAATQADHQLARLHGIWGLGQLGRTAPEALEPVVELLQDNDPHVRGQAAKVLGDARSAAAASRLIPLLRDDTPRVRLHAAIALGKVGDAGAFEPLIELLRSNADEDAYLRHAGVMGLVGTAKASTLETLKDDESPSVRLGAVLALRRMRQPEVARFLIDDNPRVVLEAARAISDEPIDAAMAPLAALELDPEMSEFLLRRVLNANHRQGAEENASILAGIAAREDLPESIRVEALDILAEWPNPSNLDRVMGVWRPLEPRPIDPAASALANLVATLMDHGPDPIRTAAARASGALKVVVAAPVLINVVSNADRSTDARLAALQALEALNDPSLADVSRRALEAEDEDLRAEAIRLLAQLDPARVVPTLEQVLETGTVREQQAALENLGPLATDAADPLLADWLDRLLDDAVPPELHLELLEAAAQRSDPEVSTRLARFEESRTESDPLAPYLETLHGGNSRRGYRIFFERTEAQCLRCHKVRGQGGEVGPDLSDIGSQKDRRYLLESLVVPDAEIAEGFETLVIATLDGQVLSGIRNEEDDETLTLMTADGDLLHIPKEDIEEQARGVSAMPQELLNELSKREIRDLVEFLSNLKETPTPGRRARP